MNKDSEYQELDANVAKAIVDAKNSNWQNPYRAQDAFAVRRNSARDKSSILRPAFVRDVEKILHLPVYNRLADKTQVFSFFKNDDITRRALHVQLVSRIARSIGSALGLNLDLIEAISIGHDIGHTPFGHVGERFLSELLHNETGLYFNHNVHSVRVLDELFKRNLTLQTLDGILCHNGELPLNKYTPRAFANGAPAENLQAENLQNANGTHTQNAPAQNAHALPSNISFDFFDAQINDCNTKGESAIKKLIPLTLEACVVRVCDMIAYLGKDRQDAVRARIINENSHFSSHHIGTANALIIHNLSVDIINNSFGKNYILLSDAHYKDLVTAKKENYKEIYLLPNFVELYEGAIKPLFKKVYYKIVDDIINERTNSVVWQHHINFMAEHTKWYQDNPASKNGANSASADAQNRADKPCPDASTPYHKQNAHLIASDFIASMTDDYFIDLCALWYPKQASAIQYHSYFEDIAHN